jgi:hypothetical protein
VTTVDVAGVLDALARAQIAYVLTGSLAAGAYGVTVTPRDFDLAPAAEEPNLARLAGVLAEIRAKPHFDPAWPVSREECERWTPHPATSENLDHLFETSLGLVDVVPWRSGSFEELSARASPAAWRGEVVLIAAPADLLAHLRLDKPKHSARRPRLEAALAAGARPDLSGWVRE